MDILRNYKIRKQKGWVSVTREEDGTLVILDKRFDEKEGGVEVEPARIRTSIADLQARKKKLQKAITNVNALITDLQVLETPEPEPI